jgi:nucleoside-diphosphate-sugar epimerase
MSDARPSADTYRNARVAILGASGFIGRWVARALSQTGADLHLLVRDTHTAADLLARYAITGRFHEIDLTNLARVREIIREINPAITFNLAGYGINRSQRDERLSHLINTELVQTLCDALAETNNWPGQALVHVGSALEYGTTAGNLAEDGPATPTTLYSQSKLAGTLAVTRSAKNNNLRALTARLFTIYGPGEHTGRLLPSLLHAAQSDQPLDLTSGQQQRDFTYVEDVAAGLLRLGLSRAEPGQIVNLATGRLTTVRQFVEIAANELGIPAHRLHFGAVPTRPEEMHHGNVTIDLLRRLLGWTPTTSIADGVRKTQCFEMALKC